METNSVGSIDPVCPGIRLRWGKRGGGTPEDPNADLPVRKKISTPVASSFKVDGRTVNIYEYTGLTFKDQILWTDTLAVDGDRIYFFGFDTKDETYRPNSGLSVSRMRRSVT